jgi:hypothetical protein
LRRRRHLCDIARRVPRASSIRCFSPLDGISRPGASQPYDGSRCPTYKPLSLC